MDLFIIWYLKNTSFYAFLPDIALIIGQTKYNLAGLLSIIKFLDLITLYAIIQDINSYVQNFPAKKRSSFLIYQYTFYFVTFEN